VNSTREYNVLEPQPLSATPYRLQRQKSGALAVHSAAYAETMHPGGGPWAEATGLYVGGSGLADRLCAPDPAPLVLFDVGLGAAANALAAVTCHAELLRQGRRPRALHVVSFESDPAAPRFALEQAEALGYPRGHEPLLAALLATGEAHGEGGLRWELRLGDFPRLIGEEPERAEVIFFDPFSPRANPEMWSLPTLEALQRCRRRAGATVLLTYSTAFGTRAGLLLAGFYVGEGPRQGRHGASTMAASWLADLSAPLTPAWLARWRHDREPWPPLTPPAAHRALRERLLEHPQWAATAQAGGDLENSGAEPPPRRKHPVRRQPRRRKGR
jgi:tRNA U34 5-methylaminomethyl-2-thiouridine-forming methyltransferase MnmC